MTWNNLTQPISNDQQSQVLTQAVEWIQLQHFALSILRDPTQLSYRASMAVHAVATRLGLNLPAEMQTLLVQQIVAQVGGLGFLSELLPPQRADLSEIAVLPDGSVWILPKGAVDFEALEVHPSKEEVWRAVEALLTPINRSVSEATPSVDAKLPRTQGMGGARIKIVHPVLAPGEGYPSISIRLFEPAPVRPERLVEWGMAPQEIIDGLLEAVSRQARILIVGGTGTGKTTFLSALCHGIPRQARVVKIENPEEIWLDHPHVVTLEARASLPGSTVPPYTIKNGVDDALRMTPRWLIVGEMRTGAEIMALFRAQMSDHPGLSTFHADSPQAAVHRIALNLLADLQVDFTAGKDTFAQAVDLLIQVGWHAGQRQVLGVWEVQPQIKLGEVQFRSLYAPGDASLQPMERR
jgi:pilus assembly protein CpaF